MKIISLIAIIVCFYVKNVVAQIDYCHVYKTALDSAYNREFGFFVDSLDQKSDFINPLSPPPLREMKNKKWVIDEHFLYIKKTTVDFEEEFIKDWFSKPAKGGKGLKHVSGSIGDNCKLNVKMHYKIIKEEKPVGIDFKGTRDVGVNKKLSIVWVVASDMIVYNRGKELIMWMTFYNPNIFRSISGERTFGIKMKLVNGKWIIKECKVNAGG